MLRVSLLKNKQILFIYGRVDGHFIVIMIAELTTLQIQVHRTLSGRSHCTSYLYFIVYMKILN